MHVLEDWYTTVSSVTQKRSTVDSTDSKTPSPFIHYRPLIYKFLLYPFIYHSYPISQWRLASPPKAS